MQTPSTVTTRTLLLAIVVLPGAASGYVPDDPWTLTASGTTSGTGSPVTLTWSLVPDGTSIPGEENSDLIAYFDDLFDVRSTSSDLTQRPWFTLFEEAFERWEELGGIDFVYESSDNGSTLQTSRGILNVRGDIRIGGTSVDGEGGTLGYATLPNSGDIVLDTSETTFFSNSSNQYLQLRNTLMHEIGHAFGLLHIESTDSALLLEPFISTSFDGPQLDDIRGLHGLYGDVYEKSNNGLGNGTYQRATSLGNLSASGSLAIGSDAVGGQFVSSTETDFISITNNLDEDFFSFIVDSPMLVDLTLTPLGGVFSQGGEGQSQASFDANSRNDLSLSLLDSDGTTLLGTADLAAAGGVESLLDIELPSAGEYYIQVAGSSDSVQLYQLQLASTALLATGLAGDYNDDGLVDHLDYNVWRDSLGQVGTALPADGNGDNIVSSDDYLVWQSNFGDTAVPTGNLTAAQVPEPTAFPLTTVACLATKILRPSRRFQR